MKKWILPTLAVTLMGWTLNVQAEVSLTQEQVASEKIKDDPEWVTALKNQHHLGDEHIQFLQEKGLSYPEIALVSTLSEKSGKTVDDILDMKSKGKMDWEKISSELDVSSVEVGRSIASVREEVEEVKSSSNKEAKREDTPKKGISKKRG